MPFAGGIEGISQSLVGRDWPMPSEEKTMNWLPVAVIGLSFAVLVLGLTVMMMVVRNRRRQSPPVGERTRQEHLDSFGDVSTRAKEAGPSLSAPRTGFRNPRRTFRDASMNGESRYAEWNPGNAEYEPSFDISQQNGNNVAELRIREANREIDELDEEMVADGFPQATDAMKDEARRIVRALARQPAAPTVHGTQDGDIAIQFDSEKSAVVIELSRAGGGAACFSYVGGKNQRARYDDSKDLPDEFVEARLRRLSRELGDGRRAAEDHPG